MGIIIALFKRSEQRSGKFSMPAPFIGFNRQSDEWGTVNPQLFRKYLKITYPNQSLFGRIV